MLLDKYSPKTNTGIHRKMRDFIRIVGFRYEEEYKVFGTYYFIDFYVPEFHMGIECDGPYHSRKKDEKRDKKIKETSGIIIYRFSQEAINKGGEKIIVPVLIAHAEEAFLSKDDRLAR